MQVEYKNTFPDLLGYQLFHQLFSPVSQGFFVLFAALIFYSESLSNGFWASLAVAATFYLLMWLIQFVFTLIYLLAAKRQSLLTNHIIELADDGVHEETPDNRSVFFWHGLVKVVRRPRFIAIYINSLAALVIPIRAFHSREDAAVFLSEVRGRINAAEPGSQRGPLPAGLRPWPGGRLLPSLGVTRPMNRTFLVIACTTLAALLGASAGAYVGWHQALKIMPLNDLFTSAQFGALVAAERESGDLASYDTPCERTFH